jgi:hypothetical protein
MPVMGILESEWPFEDYRLLISCLLFYILRYIRILNYRTLSKMNPSAYCKDANFKNNCDNCELE